MATYRLSPSLSRLHVYAGFKNVGLDIRQMLGHRSEPSRVTAVENLA